MVVSLLRCFRSRKGPGRMSVAVFSFAVVFGLIGLIGCGEPSVIRDLKVEVEGEQTRIRGVTVVYGETTIPFGVVTKKSPKDWAPVSFDLLINRTFSVSWESEPDDVVARTTVSLPKPSESELKDYKGVVLTFTTEGKWVARLRKPKSMQ